MIFNQKRSVHSSIPVVQSIEFCVMRVRPHLFLHGPHAGQFSLSYMTYVISIQHATQPALSGFTIQASISCIFWLRVAYTSLSKYCAAPLCTRCAPFRRSYLSQINNYVALVYIYFLHPLKSVTNS